MYRLLIADDERSARDGLSGLVDWQDLGFDVVAVVADGREALDYLRREPVDVVLTDVRMTFVSGIELAETIALERPDVKVVLLSGYRDFDVARQAIELNVFRYLLKPFRLAEFSEAFRRLKAGLDAERSNARGARIADSRDDASASRESSAYNDRVARAIEYIEARFLHPISLEEIADHVCVSPTYFCRLFRESVGTTFVEYINERRIQEAIRLLTRTGSSVRTVGRQAGFNDVKYFYKVFKRFTGRTPSDYREAAPISE